MDIRNILDAKYYSFSSIGTTTLITSTTTTTTTLTTSTTTTTTTTKKKSTGSLSSQFSFDYLLTSFIIAPKSALYFVPEECPDSTNIGVRCNTSSHFCNLLDPCQNGGTCRNTTDGYNCFCRPGFTGPRCESSHQLCRPDSCSNHGTYSFPFYRLLTKHCCNPSFR